MVSAVATVRIYLFCAYRNCNCSIGVSQWSITDDERDDVIAGSGSYRATFSDLDAGILLRHEERRACEKFCSAGWK